MQSTLLVLSDIAKMAGLIATPSGVGLVLPVTGVIIFFSASLLKDTVDRIGDCLGNGKPDGRKQAQLPAQRLCPR